MKQFEEVPETYEADNDEFEELYLLAWLAIVQALNRLVNLPQNLTSTKLLQLERQVNSEVKAIINDLNRKAVNMAKEKVIEAYVEGVSHARQALSQESQLVAIKESSVAGIMNNTNTGTDTESSHTIKTNLNDGHTKRLKKMIEQTQSDLLKATHNTNENIKLLVRKVVAREMANIGHGGRIGKRSNMAKRVEEELRKKFIEAGYKDADVAIIDRAKRRWKLRTYSSMVARTKMNMAYIDAVREESLQSGTDLAIISTKPDTYDDCLNYEGMIISLNGVTSGYLTYEEIKTSKKCFHPNCGHFVRPVASVDWIPPKLLQKHQRQMYKYRTK